MNDVDKKQKILRLVDHMTTSGTSNIAENRLKELVAALDVEWDFKKGDLVQWKAGLKNRAYPAYGSPAIIRNVSKTPLDNRWELSEDSGSPYFREPLTIQIGLTIDDHGYFEFWMDGRRFELVSK